MRSIAFESYLIGLTLVEVSEVVLTFFSRLRLRGSDDVGKSEKFFINYNGQVIEIITDRTLYESTFTGHD